jgi:hypothetical protein
VAEQPDEAEYSLTEAIYRAAFRGDGTFHDERKGVIAERLGIWSFDEQAKLVLAEGLRPLGFGQSMIDQLIRERSLPEMALFASHALQVFGEDLQRAGGIPAGLQEPPGLAATFNRARAGMERDVAAIDQAVAAVTGIKPPKGGRDR